jgi:hypothetical protein
MSHVGVTYKTGLGVVGFIVPYTFTTRDYRQYSSIAIVHTSQFTVTHALGFPVFTSRVLATDLSQSHRNLKSHVKSSCHSPFLPLFCNCQFRRLDSIQFLCSQAHILAGWHLEARLSTVCCSIEFFFITTLHKPQGKHRFIFSPTVLGVFTAPLHNNGRGADHMENSLCIVEACLPRARVY